MLRILEHPRLKNTVMPRVFILSFYSFTNSVPIFNLRGATILFQLCDSSECVNPAEALFWKLEFLLSTV